MTKINYIRILDYMADLYHAEFTFASCDEDQQNEIIHKFIKTLIFFKTESDKYYKDNAPDFADDLDDIEVEAEEVKPYLKNYNRYDG